MPHGLPSGSGTIDSLACVALVEGDVVIDCHIATERGPSEMSLWHEPDERVPLATRAGGVSLLGELLRRIAGSVKSPEWDVIYRKPALGTEKDFSRLYTVWYRYDRDHDVPEAGWRINKFLGSDSPIKRAIPEPLISSSPPDLIVIDDKGHQFRHEPAWWENTISQANANTWFLIRIGRPLIDEGMWQALRDRNAKVIAVTTADDIRQKEVFVSRRLSWELTAQDLYDEMLENKNPALSLFAHCDYVAVCFTASAVVLIENAQPVSTTTPISPARCWLIYDPSSLEDEEWRDPQNGRTHGHTYCIIAAIAKYLFQSLPSQPNAVDMSNVIKNGLKASRNLYEKGFELSPGSGIRFPFERIVQQVTEGGDGVWGHVEVPSRAAKSDWTIFQSQAIGAYGSLERLARQIVKEGIDGPIRKLPFYKVGDLVVADRKEIENFRSVQRLFKEYAGDSGTVRPLSIAVFGPPGCGKSFGIEQLAKSEIGGVGFAPITCNLSQLTTPDDLRGAFHQIRDKSLSGKLPLVFWDEFDCSLDHEPLGWLRFFLSPMQDGRFRESQTEHFIGRAIFVFAGGTKRTVEEFCADINSDDEKTRKVCAERKLPDFVSRLKGYLNVLGLNPSPSVVADPLYIIRRAVVLHSQLRKHRQLITRDNGINIDEGVLNALLFVNEYRHGVRSMEAAISMSLLSDRNRFERSSLPLEDQLNLHVNAKEFLELLRS